VPEIALGALPGLFLVLATVAARRLDPGDRLWRRAMLIGMVLTAAWCVIGTEALGAMRLLSRWPILLWWAAPAAVMGAWTIATRHSDSHRAQIPTERLDAWGLAFRCMTIGLLAMCFVLGALTPPNNWDSLIYHLPRQVYWLQQGSVEHFPATLLRTVVMPPLTEYMGLHLLALTSVDAWHNLVQCVALTGVAAGGSMVAQEMGTGRRGQAFAGLASVSMPTALMQAASPKNDVMVALWAMVLLVCAIRVLREGRCGVGRSVLIGATLGLILLTKGSGPIVAFPMCATIGVTLLARRRARAIGPGLVMLALALAPNAPSWNRNLELFGRPLGPPDHDGGFAVTNESHDPRLIASVIVRSIAQHVDIPVSGVSDGIDGAVRALHAWAGLEVDEPRTTYHASPPFGMAWRGTNGDTAGGPAHLILAVVLPVFVAMRARRRRWAQTWQTAVVVAMPYAMFLLMCVLLKWQVWNTRLHVPIACVLGAVSSAFIGESRRGGPLMALLMLLGAAPAILMNEKRALIGDGALYRYGYQDRMYLGAGEVRVEASRTAEMAAAVRGLGPRSIGFMFGIASWREYPALRSLRRAGVSAPVWAFNAPFGPREPDERPAPDVLIFASYRGGDLIDRVTGQWYALRHRIGEYWIFVPAEPTSADLDPYPPALVSITDRFRGWTLVEGLGHAEGPYPKMGLPSVRWGLGARTVLRVNGVGRDLEVVMTCRGNGMPGQGVEVWLGDRLVMTHQFGPGNAFETIRVPLGVVRGRREVRIRYLIEPLRTTSDGRALAVLYSSLVVTRKSEIDSPRGENPDDQGPGADGRP
jgi:hypothetical protein